MSLNKEQMEAVNHTDGPLVVLAVPGSGKTRCLTERIIRLLKSGVDQNNIVAITFTNKAADTMRNRILAKYPDASKMWISTFHSLCVKILHKCIKVLGRDSKFTIIDDSIQSSILKRIMKKLGLAADKKADPTKYLSAIEHKKNEYISDDIFFKTSPKDVVDVYKEYTAELDANNALDFSDLIYKVVELFDKFPKIRDAYATRFKYILVDEVQDTNKIQMLLVKHLGSQYKNMMLVGDRDQCIYGWRGARYGNITEFIAEYNAKIIKLEYNYRSTKHILESASSLISNNTDRHNVVPWTDREGGANVTFCVLDDARAEVDWICDKIKEMRADGQKWGDFAVLYRINSMSRLFEEQFRERDIPYVLIGSFGFYDRSEIKTCMAYMRFLMNNDDSMAFADAISTPPRNVGDSTVTKIIKYSTDNNIKFMEACRQIEKIPKVTSSAAESIKNFINLIDSWDSSKPAASLKALFNDCGLISYYDNNDQAKNETRCSNVIEFIESFRFYCNRHSDASIDKYMHNIALMSSTDKDDDSDNVKLMTVHAAKGLEFPCVFVPGMEEEILPHKKSIKTNTIDEERRICYVAYTRAQDNLMVTMAKVRNECGTLPSRFIKESKLM